MTMNKKILDNQRLSLVALILDVVEVFDIVDFVDGVALYYF